MYRMSIIAESLENQELLKQWSNHIVNQRMERVEGDEEELWHIYELHFPEKDIFNVLDVLVNEVKSTWYIHAFNEKDLYVAMKGKYFKLAQQRDESWNEMIEYGRKVAKVDDYYLTSISCAI